MGLRLAFPLKDLTHCTHQSVYNTLFFVWKPKLQKVEMLSNEDTRPSVGEKDQHISVQMTSFVMKK